ncbi:hypothetical protein BCR34DRAFT_278667 [Clohesyomyces aquaticus]|uniref:Uncharacterized protein n=1 Tax=Clohesyomyces aquaticus TaxID=1231657 RepID=A0A1Y1ZS16_9PLEO|nr:hypothetical protein BCR34DRAFT_278667 [Clohesyomyces aquaticus]
MQSDSPNPDRYPNPNTYPDSYARTPKPNLRSINSQITLRTPVGSIQTRNIIRPDVSLLNLARKSRPHKKGYVLDRSPGIWNVERERNIMRRKRR